MAQRINAAVVVNPINLFAMAIVPSPRQALDERGLAQQIEWLTTIASRLPYSPDAVLVADDPAAAIAQAIALGFATRVAHPLGDIVKVPDKEVSTLNYLRNNVLHAYRAAGARREPARRDARRHARSASPSSSKAACRSCARS